MILEFLSNSIDTLRVIWKEDKLLWVGVLGRWMTRQLVFPHPPNNSSFPDFSPHILDEMRCKTGNTFSLFFFPIVSFSLKQVMTVLHRTLARISFPL